MSLITLCCTLFALIFSFDVRAEPVLGYYRYPTLHGDRVVFTAEGDLWRVGVEGGVAHRLTTHAERETHARFSPDGTWIAFSASYEGPREVYVMPAEGGLPRRLTWHGGAVVVGWTPSGEVLYRTRAFSTLPDDQLVRVDPESREAERVPLAQAAQGAYTPDGSTLFFTRYRRQSSKTRRYRGGTAENLWRFGAGDAEAVPLTADYPGTSASPMVWGDRLYFVSDRDGTMNLWSMALDGSDLEQHTGHRGWEVKEPHLHDGRIVYRQGADLRLYEIATGMDRALPVRLASDMDQWREQWVDDPMEWLSAAWPSPDGERVVLTARGEVFVAPTRAGRLVAVTRAPGVRYRAARFMPDGESLVALSDQSGEVEFWRLPADGMGEPEPLTRGGDILKFQGKPSPDGRWLAWVDKNHRLFVQDLESDGEPQEIHRATQRGMGGLAWSPDSRWLAYHAPNDNNFAQVYVHGLESGESRGVTTGRTDDYDPCFSPDGKWLYFLSDRHLVTLVPSPWGPRQPEPFLDDTTRIYALALQEDLRFPFQEPDELHPEIEKSGEEAETGIEPEEEPRGRGLFGLREPEPPEEEPPPEVEITWEGLPERLYRVPVEPGNYVDLAVTADRLYWAAWTWKEPKKRDLVTVEIHWEDPEVETFVSGIEGHALSGDGTHILLAREDHLYVVEAGESAPEDLSEHEVPLSDWSFTVDPREQWRQMFVEAWRLERDYFYDPDMHGLDWEAMLDRFLPLVDRVTDRAELSDLVAQMVSELSALHIFVYGGDFREDSQDVAVADLGARLVRAPQADGWRVEHIHRSDPDYPEQRSPLLRPQVDMAEGDVILAVNGVDTLDAPHLGALLRNQAGRQVRLTVRPAKGGELRDVVVKPLSAGEARDLRYREWEYERRMMVERWGEGQLGYVHLRAMGKRDYTSWARDFYPVYNRGGLVVDVRHNRGGNIDSWILEKLMRKAWFYWQPRVGEPTWNMQYAFRGHMVLLCDAHTASDGEAMAEGFRRLGLGPVLGTRTWGGEIWLSSSNWLVDGGIATAAEFGVYGPEGKWLIEGHGVEPDRIVDNLPHATFEGEDAQLRAAVDLLLRKLEEDPVPVPEHPPYPDKSPPY